MCFLYNDPSYLISTRKAGWMFFVFEDSVYPISKRKVGWMCLLYEYPIYPISTRTAGFQCLAASALALPFLQVQDAQGKATENLQHGALDQQAPPRVSKWALLSPSPLGYAACRPNNLQRFILIFLPSYHHLTNQHKCFQASFEASPAFLSVPSSVFIFKSGFACFLYYISESYLSTYLFISIYSYGFGF